MVPPYFGLSAAAGVVTPVEVVLVAGAVVVVAGGEVVV
jgi:hypothetical protein